MTDWVDRDVSHLGTDRIATSPTAFALYQNLIAAFEKAAGAPVLANSYVVSAMIAAGAVTAGKLGSGAVLEANFASSVISQGKLKTTTGSVGATFNGNITLPGGTYGFYPQVATDASDSEVSIAVGINSGSFASFSTNVYVQNNGTVQTISVLQRYVQGSPPYNLGDGDVPMFVFMGVDTNGDVKMFYVAEDPPWAHNGPTSIVPDKITPKGMHLKALRRQVDKRRLRDPRRRDQHLAELAGPPIYVPIDQSIKQADMPIIPHPFMCNDMQKLGLTVTLLDPVSAMALKLRDVHNAGGSVPEILMDGYLKIGNEALERKSPPGVIAVGARWN